MIAHRQFHRQNIALPWCLIFAALLTSAGCSKFSTDYGKSKGVIGRHSLNGFAALRNTYSRAGFHTRDISRLSERVARTDTIVWTPQEPNPISTEVTGWFDRWLRKGGRTLVYVVPDSGSECDYWIDAGKLAPPPQRLEYRKRAAESINRRMVWRLNRDAIQSNGWFRVEPIEHRTQLGNLKGDWAGVISDQPQQRVAAATEFRVTPFDPDAPNPANTSGPVARPTGPSSSGWSYFESTSPTKTPIRFRPLLLSETEAPAVAEITSKRWADSKIIVVAGGSLLTNYAFTRQINRNLVEQIVRTSTPHDDADLTAGFLTSNWQPIPVSKLKQGVPQASGMELLTVWPLSIVTTHGVMLGLVICLMLWPIFGRPKRVRQLHQNDFGDHLDAVAALMNRAGGEAYARARISEYMRRMHQETSGPWVLPDPPPTVAPPAIAAATSAAKPQVAPARIVAPQASPAEAPPSLASAAGRTVSGEAERSTNPTATQTATRAVSDPETDPAAPQPVDQRTRLLAICDDILERRMRETAGREPERIENGVSIPGLEVVRSEGKLVRLSESSVLCVLAVNAKLTGPAGLSSEIREFVTGDGSSGEQAVRKSASNYMDVAFPPILALIDDGVAAKTAIRPAGLADGWEFFTGKRLIEGDEKGWLTARLAAASVLSLFGQSLSSIFSQPEIHSCSLSASHTARQQLQLECYIDGLRSPQAEQQVRHEMSKSGAIEGVWQLRQFYTMRPIRPFP
jgi:hypothetical protein